ncbi:efflux transporter outer membrane subunit [Rhizomicrobium electricum]|jgi:NodT family efflux transporter outer membrane factor (OMF) lipoprotein|uniref:Efflux transporter outer membrane subunit n=1 Tax=Rhizomicrobium electricum TaxID=480070 RepID=A0ABP3PBP0_9PROT|nr:efflux transporter outer membrane subunit [Rhizomicrobium electricum]NIJ48229.1 NodT family efflux transporter outer membrane factor (OMF) lipoprotein [Rhizomicrobium electricum]
MANLRRRALCSSAALAGIVAFALAGCAPDLGPKPEMAAPGSLASAKSLVAPAAEWPVEAWWKAYNDPQLDRLIDDALKDSPDLKMAAARVRAAEAMADINESLLWPTIVGDATFMETEITQNIGLADNYMGNLFKQNLPKGFHHLAALSLGMQYQLDLFGKNHANFAAAMSTAEAAKADEASARLQIAAGMATYYAILTQLFADEATSENAVKVRSESAALVEKRFKSGLENEASLSQARAQMESAKVQLEAVKAATLKVRHAIAALAGKGPDYGLAIEPAATHPLRSDGLPASLAADLVGRRPDVVAARKTVEGAGYGIDAANANFYPNIDLTGMYGFGTLDAKHLFDASSEMAGIGPALRLPIFDYGRNKAIYRASRAKFDAAVALYDKTLTNALKDVADAYSDRKALDGELLHARKALSESENAYRVIRVRYDAGMARYIDVLTVEDKLLAVRMAVADLEAQAFARDIALIRALGGGYTEKK